MIVIVGDWCPAAGVTIVRSHDDIFLANLEGPVLPIGHNCICVPKAGPYISSRLLPSHETRFVFSLANNHVMDYGPQGLEKTLNLLDDSRVQYCGAGGDVSASRQPIIIEDSGIRFGMIACCEAQFGVARAGKCGVAELGPWIYRAIRGLRNVVDSVVVSVHAAIEDSPWPSPFFRALYHSFIDAGAAVVHGHHAHVPQGYEEYGDGVIFYGLGNFAVDPDKWQHHPNGMWSLAAEVDLVQKPIRWRPLTFEIRRKNASGDVIIEESDEREHECHRQYLEICNRPFSDDVLFEALWQEVALSAYNQYGSASMGFASSQRNWLYTHFRECLSMLKGAVMNGSNQSRVHHQSDLLRWYHMIACESHREMLATALGVLGGEIRDLRTMETRHLVHSMLPWRFE